MSTIHDVARHAGVAPSTVSYALSGKRSISAKTRDRINKAIEALEFSPSILGRRLRNSHSNTIGLAFPVSEADLAWETLDFLPSVAATLNKRGYGLSIFTEPMTPEQILKLHRENQVDGLLLMQGLHHDERVEKLRHTDYPFVLFGRCANTGGINLVDFDPDQAMFQIFEHLVQLGHKHIGYLNWPPKKRSPKLGFSRLVQSGFMRAQQAFDVVTVVEETDGSIESGYRATLSLLKREPRISAFVTLPNGTHVGILRALREQGRRVPEDFSIIGISRLNWAQWTQPQLTSADIPLIDMVRTGAEMLLRQIAGEDVRQQVIYPAKLILRESTAQRR